MQKELEQLGLSDKEAKVYLASLGLGPAQAGRIARQAGIKRPNTYVVLEHLVKLGLVSQVADTKEKTYKAEEPDRLIRLTKKMRRQVVEAEIELEKLLPGLKSIQKKLIEVPKVVFYQGIEGVRNIIIEASEYPEPWYYFGSAEGWFKALSEKGLDELVLETRELRQKAGRPMSYIITDESYHKIKFFQNYESNIRQAKILPHLIQAKSAFIIYGNKLGVLSVGSAPFGAVIESQEVAELVKIMYMMIWQSLPEERGK